MDACSITRDQLKFLIRDRDSDSLVKLGEFGGTRGVAKKLLVDPATGISGTNEIVKLRMKTFGSNFIPPPHPRSYLSFLKDAFGDLTILILCCAALIDLGIAVGYSHTSSSYAESSAILVSIAVVTNVAALNDFRKQSQFRKLNAVVDNMAVVTVRGGQKVSVLTNDIVVGDIVTLSVGDIICADGLLLEGYSIEMDESSLTGETKNVRKSTNKNPFLLSGTKVMDGTGFFVVVAVGEHSESGQIRMIVQGGTARVDNGVVPNDARSPPEEEKSVLTAKLDSLATNIGKAGTIVALLCFVVMVTRFCIEHYALSDPEGECALIGDALCLSPEVIGMNDDLAWPSCPSTSLCCEDTSLGAVLRGRPCPWLKVHAGEFIGFFITAVTILVVAVPEGLPLAVTLALAFSVIRMQADNNLVKHLDACETMGSATTICSDKTGTLTKNRMTVMRAFLAGASFKPGGTLPLGLAVLGFSEGEYLCFLVDTTGRRILPVGQRRAPLLHANIINIFTRGIALNSTGDIRWDSNTRLWQQMGNKTDCALLQLVEDLGFEYTEIRERMKPYILKSFPFNSAKKRSTCVVQDESIIRVHVKGASEMVLALCTSMLDMDGELVALTDEKRALVDAKISEYASLAMRTICLAYREYTVAPSDWETRTVDDESYVCETDLILIGLVGIEDPLRDEVPEAILRCRGAGVDVRMVTGDNIDTAIAIAKGCGILRPTDLLSDGSPRANSAMTGPDFRKRVVKPDGSIDRIEFDAIWPHLRVLARSSPTDKFTLVSGLSESELYRSAEAVRTLGIYPDRQVVAVTGDGTNDAPALKRADVGFAMGITGTAVAKEAADIILLDDNFASIVVSCMWGRNVHEGIAKFLQFQLTVNVVALVLAIEGSLFYSESPLKAVQMLWVNLIMDSLASLALATEAPTLEHLQRPPIGRNQSMISSEMIWNILGQSIYQLTVLNIILFAGPDIFGYESGAGQGVAAPPSEHYTCIFNSFVLIQLCNQINSRKLHHEWKLFSGLFRGKLFVSIMLVEIAVQVIVVQLGGTWFHTAPLSKTSWILGFVLALCAFPVQWTIVWLAAVARRVRARAIEVKHGGSDTTDEAGTSSLVHVGEKREPLALRVNTKRHETAATMQKGMSKLGSDAAKKQFALAGTEYQNKRKSTSSL